jgi:hypothetical protein
LRLDSTEAKIPSSFCLCVMAVQRILWVIATIADTPSDGDLIVRARNSVRAVELWRDYFEVDPDTHPHSIVELRRPPWFREGVFSMTQLWRDPTARL